jgi:inner membrane protein
MLKVTHILFSVNFYLICLNLNLLNFNLLGIIILIAATLLPDIDVETSRLGKRFKVISFAFTHRGFFHSMLFFVFGYLILYYSNVFYLVEFSIGYLGHVLLDSINYGGVMFFWPLPFKVKGFIKTNSLTEKLLRLFFFVSSSILFLFLLY